jgi:hypothetical protein
MMMQHHGETARIVDSHVWIKWVTKRIGMIEKNNVDPLNRTTNKIKTPDVYIITDVRRLYEAESIWNADGEVWKIQRDDRPPITGLPNHLTEKEVKEIPDSKVQAIIANNQSEDSLRATLSVEFSRFMRK